MLRIVLKREKAKASMKRLSIEPTRKRVSFVNYLLSPKMRIQRDWSK